MRVIDAAKLMEYVYTRPDLEPDDLRLDLNNAQVTYVSKFRSLVIEGTNEAEDWVLFNFNLFFSTIPQRGDSKAWYHAGFYNHAQTVYSFARTIAERIELVIGHSLGAASAQIVGPSLGKTTVAFASPKPLLRGKPLRPELVTNYNRDDDLVCRVPPGIADGLVGFAHIGTVKWMEPAQWHPGEDHRIDKYIDLLSGQYRKLGQAKIHDNLPTFP